MEPVAMVQFVFTGVTLDAALSKLLDHLKGPTLDGYHVVDVVAHLAAGTWRVVVYCLADCDGKTVLSLLSSDPPAGTVT